MNYWNSIDEDDEYFCDICAQPISYIEWLHNDGLCEECVEEEELF